MHKKPSLTDAVYLAKSNTSNSISRGQCGRMENSMAENSSRDNEIKKEKKKKEKII